MRIRSWQKVAAVVAAVVAATATVQAAPVAAAGSGFYTYQGTRPLADVAPGTPLATRHLTYSVAGVPVPVHVTQVLYRTEDARRRPAVNVTSVLEPPSGRTSHRVVAYQSFYDSLNPADSPSRAIAGGTSPGGFTVHAETVLMAPLLLQGASIVVTDTEGQAADFAAGPEYGRTTLDALRAVSRSSASGIAPHARIGLVGYSGGAIATNWAAALAPHYAPDINRRLVGAAEGGVLVEPDHNLHYIQGSAVWAGVMAMALVGIGRAYHVDLTRYLTPYGAKVYAQLQDASIADVLGRYPGMTWSQLAKPKYPTPESLPIFVRLANRLDLGTRPTPTVPMFIGQGANGILEGTPGSKPGIGRGDGVMIAGDVRSLARQYCAAGLPVRYHQYNLTSHVTTAPLWLTAAYTYLAARFAGRPAGQNCATIRPGNSLAPVSVQRG